MFADGGCIYVVSYGRKIAPLSWKLPFFHIAVLFVVILLSFQLF